MRLVLTLIVFVTALVLKNDAAQPEQELDEQIAVLERSVQMLTTSVWKVLAEMSDVKTEMRLISKRCDQQQNYLAKHPEDDLDDESRFSKMDPQLNDTNLEERVQALEFQMANVHDDITALNTDVADLDEDVESQFVLVEGEITVVNEQITIIFEEIFQLEDETDTLDSNIEVIEEMIDGLTATDSELTALIDELDSRVTTLESLNGTDEDVINILNEHETEINLLNITVEDLLVDVANVEETIVSLQQSDEEQGTAINDLDTRVTDLESLNGTNGDVDDAFE